MKSQMQSKDVAMKPRSLKVQPILRGDGYNIKEVPEIRLCGEWLRRFGFLPGMQVSVRSVGATMLIEKIADAPPAPEPLFNISRE